MGKRQRGAFQFMRRVLLGLMLLGVGMGTTACSSRRGCPPGMDAVRQGPGPSVLCRDGKGIHQSWIRFHEGTLRPKLVCSFAGTQPEGEFRGFHPDGREWIRGQYMSGKKDGVWVQFDKNGSKVAEGEYRFGRIVAGAPVGVAATCEDVPL